MFVISAGMPKSGSGYLYNALNDLLAGSGGADARNIKEKTELGNILQWYNNNVDDLGFGNLFKLWKASRKYGAFVVKTHSPPSLASRWMAALGMVKVVYSYRDPRDVILSAIDHGEKIRAAGENHTFASFTDVSASIPEVKTWIDIWRSFQKEKNCLSIRYETLLDEPGSTLQSISDYLGLKANSDLLESIVQKYDRKNDQGTKTGLHFNKAVAGRYKEMFTPEDQEVVRESIGREITEMGYTF
ncbi:MAG: sulfotransferase domain-containing protein [Flavobacteriales bacterium]|nr:sulfotransferase domain-containing protein [Flavobacteriales bacterium]